MPHKHNHITFVLGCQGAICGKERGNLGEMKKPTVQKVLLLVQKYYAKPGNLTGGCLHLVLDDGNLDDDYVEYCLGVAEEHHDADGVELAQLLLQMSLAQREKLYKSATYSIKFV